jgi:hypothetical protein
MSRVETSENIGPNPFHSVKGAVAPAHGPVVKSQNYTKHSYQLICSGVGPSTDVAFIIYATNDQSTKWQSIANYTINASRNSNGVLYFDCWNFKYCKASVIGAFGGATISVIEKHNA